MDSLYALMKGIVISAGLFVAIGPLNSYVIRKALRRQNIFLIALVCSLIEGGLVVIGVSGLSLVLAKHERLMIFVRYGGAAFLLWYAYRCFLSAWKGGSFDLNKNEDPTSARRTVLILMVLGILNPSILIETLVVIGGIGAQYPMPDRIFFTIGSILTAFAWFFSVCYGVSYFSPLMRNPRFWIIFDTIIGGLMVGIAASLIFYV
jgi:L-lysine exporter family protein LysE/ArgO